MDFIGSVISDRIQDDVCEKSNFSFKYTLPANLAKGLAQEDPFTLSVTALYFMKCQIR